MRITNVFFSFVTRLGHSEHSIILLFLLKSNISFSCSVFIKIVTQSFRDIVSVVLLPNEILAYSEGYTCRVNYIRVGEIKLFV